MATLKRIPLEQPVVYYSNSIYFQCHCGNIVQVFRLDESGIFYMKGHICPHFLVRTIGAEVEVSPIISAKHEFYDITDEGISIRRGLPDYVESFLEEYYNPEDGPEAIKSFDKDFSMAKKFFEGEVGVENLDNAEVLLAFKLFY